MRFIAAFAVTAALGASTTSAAPTAQAQVPDTHALHEDRRAHTEQWLKKDRLSADALLPMRIALTQSNLHKGYDLLMDVSHPESHNYGKHYSASEVDDLFAPSEDSVNTVRQWLAESGIGDDRVVQSDNRGWLAFMASAAEAEKLLHTKYHSYEHADSGYTTTSCDEYHVPKHVQAHIDYITPGVKLFAPADAASRKNKRSNMMKRTTDVTTNDPTPPMVRISAPVPAKVNGTATCDQVITPACIKSLYQIPNASSKIANNTLGIFEEGDFYSQGDFDLFFGNFTPGIPKGTHPLGFFIDGASGPTNVGNAGIESDLDFAIAYPLIWPQQITLFQTDDDFYSSRQGGKRGFFNTFLDAIDGSYCNATAFGEKGNDPALDPSYPNKQATSGFQGKLQCGTAKPTNVLSISYGGQEADLPFYYQMRQCNEFMKLGLQGVTILFASGDFGVGAKNGHAGLSNGCLGSQNTIFSPTWPNNCPFVTNVGGTMVPSGQNTSQPEVAMNEPVDDSGAHPIAFSTGGGFSNVYSIPNYQQSAVASYFANFDPGYKFYSTLHNATGNMSTPIGANGGIYNRIGRGIPDVSANGDNIGFYNQGDFGTATGTSASTPIFASIINLINEKRIAANKSTVGFINPTLYSCPDILNDITSGSNPGCGTNGFTAVPGWDPVTGLGTPNYPRMLNKFMSLP